MTLNPVLASPAGSVITQFGPTVPPTAEDGVVVWAQSLCTTAGTDRRSSASRATILLDAARLGP